MNTSVIFKDKMICPLLAFILIFQASCKKDWLDIKANKKLTVPSTFVDFQAMLDNNGLYMNVVSGFNEIASDGHFYTDAAWNSMTGKNSGNAYTWTNDVPYSTATDWNVPYARILDMNIILDGVGKVEIKDNADQILADHIKSQALFNRSRLFFNLAQTFCTAYASNVSALGIPLRLSSDITIPSKRSTLHETYDKIIADLLEAKDKLPLNPDFLTRASKPAALALLARIYLSMEKYQEAGDYANQCLQLKGELMDYGTIPSNQTFIGVNKEVIFLEFLLTTGLTTTYLIDPALYNLYDANDLRRSVFFRLSGGNQLFKGHYSNSTSHIFGGTATDELYLIRSECYARAGNFTAAMKDLNDLLRTRWGKNINGTTKYVDQTANNETEALQKILLERRKELILRNLRWSDLRRLNRDNRFKITITRSIGGKTYTLEPNSYKYTFPIPIDIIQQTNMEQNPGW